MSKKTYMLTKEGYKQLEKKLKIMRTQVRPEVIERIRQAKESGGPLEENTEYENAKDEQSKVEHEIAKLEDILRNAKIIKKEGNIAEHVDLGTTVTIENTDEGNTVKFEIVSSQESDPLRNPPRISDESPIGLALMGKEKGEIVEVNIPLGLVKYKILEIMNTP